MSGAREDLPAGLCQAPLYPVTEPARGADEPRLAVCLSGGGSRALSCALGQLSALRSLPDPAKPGASLMDRVAYLSSVSGGSWASVVYTFLPETIDGQPVGDDDLLITPLEPQALIKRGPGDAEAANVAYLNPHSLGTAPQRFDLKTIARFLHTLKRWDFFRDHAKWSWFWIAAVGELILKPFGLYQARYDPARDYPEPERFFSLSPDHVAATITPSNPGLTPDAFYTARAGRPPLIVNTNLLQHADMASPPQTPVQATPVETGILGRTPDGTLAGGGSVESFAFTSTLAGPGPDGSAAVGLKRRYSLCDVAGCSSAFFAEFLLKYLNQEIDKIAAELERALEFPGADKLVAKLERELVGFLDADASRLIPRYNYWPLGAVAGGDGNKSHGFSDGGDFENTGILGLLARTDANRIVAFVNSEYPLRKDPGSGEALVSGQLALLFGYRADPDKNGRYVSYGGMSPGEPMSYAQVFDDDAERDRGCFAQLRDGLYRASCGGPDRDSALGTDTAAFTQRLRTVDNPVAHIRGGREVRVLWVYNNRVNRWQDAIVDASIRSDLARGQADQNRDGTPADEGAHGSGPVANFPWYATAEQIHLDPEGVNILAQLSAWNVAKLKAEIERLVAS